MCILVSSTEDTTEDGSRWEVTEPRTVAKGGLETDKETGEGTIQSQKVTLCHTQSINGLCRVNQSSPSTMGIHSQIWLIKTRYAEVSCKGT